MSNIPETSVDSNKTVEKIAETLYLQAPVSNGAIFVIAFLCFFLLESYSNSILHFGWSFLMVIVASYRLFLWSLRNRSLRKNTAESQTASYWINHYIFASVIVGFSWGSLFLLPYVNHDEILYGTLLMAFFGVTASTVPILSISLTVFLGYTLPIIICFIIAIYNFSNLTYIYLIIAAIVYYLMLFLFARNSNKQIIHAINLQFQNENLINQLRQEVEQRESSIRARTKQLEQSKQDILDSENRLKNVIIGAELGYWDWNYQTDHHEVNDRWLNILGLSRDDINNNVSDWNSLIHPEDKQRMITTVEDAIKNHTPYVADFRMKHKDGHWVWIQGSGSVIESDSITGEPLRLCGTHQDISYRKEIEEKLEYRAKHDYLTGLYNRIELENHIQNELARAERYEHNLSLFLIDIDHFKQINDSYGHQTGDEILKQFALFLQETVRTTDYVARYGGEEFVVILHETNLQEAEELAERLRSKTEALNFSLKQALSKITICIGIASYPEHGQSYDEILEMADSAMYQAKNNGRNRIRAASI